MEKKEGLCYNLGCDAVQPVPTVVFCVFFREKPRGRRLLCVPAETFGRRVFRVRFPLLGARRG